MCGRFTLTSDQMLIKDYIQAGYDIQDFDFKDSPRYNIAPTQHILALLHDGSKYRIGYLKWGFKPTFSKDDPAFYMINAKSETLDEKPFFKQAFHHKRCIILADGFYEWKKADGVKIPMYIYLKNHQLFGMAGIYETYINQSGEKIHTTAIITTQANDLMSEIHDRMPVILDTSNAKKWLNRNESDHALLKNILLPYNSIEMIAHEVSPLVNSVKNDLIDCIKPTKKAPTLI